MPGSRTRPRKKPNRISADQVARTIDTGVKWALGAAGERRVVRRTDGRLQFVGQSVPALAKLLGAGSTEHAVGKIRCAKAGEADQLSLLVRTRRPILALNLGRHLDRSYIVVGPLAPSAGKIAGPHQAKVDLWLLRRCEA